MEKKMFFSPFKGHLLISKILDNLQVGVQVQFLS